MKHIICIDGPSGSGKGTVSNIVAQTLGFRYLDSGAIYRVLGYLVQNKNISLENVDEIVALAATMNVEFCDGMVIYQGDDISAYIRTETAGNQASKIAAIPEVRKALVAFQQQYAKRGLGLVADGRDMGSVIFPNAILKIFLTASAETRAQRRYKQLLEKGENVTLRALVNEIEERDRRDRERSASPLVAAVDAFELDSTSLTIEQVVSQVVELWRKKSNC